MKAYVISDTHFGHDKIVEYCNRPEDHEERIFNNILALLSGSLLIHLGDFCIGNDEAWHARLAYNFLGKKILIMGNHDSKSWSWYMEHGWDFVCDAFRLKYCGKIIMFSHMPQPWDGVWEINVHGHLHNLGHRAKEFQELRQWHRLYAPELSNYQPVELSSLIQKDQYEIKPN